MNQKGFIGVLITIIFVGIASSLIYYVVKDKPYFKEQTKQEPSNLQVATSSASTSEPAVINALPTPIVTPKPTSLSTTSQKVLLPPSPTSQPTTRAIYTNGFIYEDRNDNGIFDSDDPKIANAMLLYYDSTNPSTKLTYHTNADGSFNISMYVKGNLMIQLAAWGGFVPKSPVGEYKNSTQNIKFAYRSASAPAGGNVGILEGDVFQDSNRNLVRDSGEQGIYFYKFYVLDTDGNYYDGYPPDPGGHFKYEHLPLGKTYIIRLSNPTGDYIIDKPETSITLSTSYFQNTNLQIPVYKVSP